VGWQERGRRGEVRRVRFRLRRRLRRTGRGTRPPRALWLI